MALILMVEPDVRLADTYAQALRLRAHKVAACRTAQEAVVLADQRTPDAVLLELQLVAHGGIEFLYEFRSYADWRHVPVVVVSHVPPAELARSQQLLAGQLGVRAYCYKPELSLRKLLSVVDSVLAPAANPGKENHT